MLLKHIHEKNDYQLIVKAIYDNREKSNEYTLGLLFEEGFHSIETKDINNVFVWLKQLVDL